VSPLAFIPSPSSNGIHLGPVFFHAYGIAYVFAVLAAIAITRRRWEAFGGRRELVYEVAAWGFPAGLIGGRIYFLLSTPSQVPPHWWGPFALWKGGLGIWGGIAAGAAAGIWLLHRRRADVPAFMDAAAPALLVAQSIGRIGNYFNQELFGGPTTLPWGLQIAPAHRPPGYAQYATFHPTFLYEIIWNLSLAAFLVWLGRRGKIKSPGLFALYVAGYSAFRIFEESLRVDYSNHFLGLRVNFYVASVLCITGLGWFVAIQRGWRPRLGRRARRGAGAIGLAWIIAWAAGCGTEGSRGAAAQHPWGRKSELVVARTDPVGAQAPARRA
jgi:prolipoprotein diacylglyceryl transferase